MNRKLIAIAVASAVALPTVASADGHEGVKVYGRINNAIVISDDGANSNTDVSTIGSRFGIKASSDLGNGLTASGQYEFSTTTDKEQTAIGDIRVAKVGLSGAFGNLFVGNQWGAFFGSVGTDMDPSYWVGGLAYAYADGPYRTSNTIQYSNSFGDGKVTLMADLRINDSGEGGDVAEAKRGNGHALGVRLAATDSLTFGVAMDSEDGATSAEDTDMRGISMRASFGNFWGSVGHIKSETDTTSKDATQLFVGASFGKTSFLLGHGSVDQGGGGDDGKQLTFGIYHNMGGGMKLYFESSDESDFTAGVDASTHLVGMRYDF